MLPLGSVRYATIMPSSSSIGATTTLPPSSSVWAAVAATSATWTTKTAYGGMLPPVLKIPPEGPAAPGAVISVYALPGANDQAPGHVAARLQNNLIGAPQLMIVEKAMAAHIGGVARLRRPNADHAG